jgi:hypothetical protein
MSALANKDYAFVYNYVLGVHGKVVPEETMKVVKERLAANGFERWLSEVQ